MKTILSEELGSFNPLPVVKPGDAQRLAQHRLAARVSIRSRWLNREMLATRQRQPAATRFNPLPVVKPGDAHYQPGTAIILDVSIRSRWLNREMRVTVGKWERDLVVSIRSRWLNREMPGVSQCACVILVFQSAPGG